MGATRRFSAEIEAGGGGGALVTVPFDAKAVFGSGRPKVHATFDGIAYRGSIASMGGRYVLGLVKSVREQLGKGVGDRVTVTVRADTEERMLEMPDELAAALRRRRGAASAFAKLSYTKRKEIVRAVASAKREETRKRRAEQAARSVLEGS